MPNFCLRDHVVIPVLVLAIGGGFIACSGGVIASSTATANTPAENPWGKVVVPSKSAEPVVIGRYSAGCIDGAKKFPVDGPGYQAMRLSRNRFYGHPMLLRYLRSLGADAKKRSLGTILIGDLAQPRGGPMVGGHASHQTGLDVDVWFWSPPYASSRKLTPQEREELSALSVVNEDGETLKHDLWRPENVKLLKFAASAKNVDRIFVNAAIKRELCHTISPKSRHWIHKLRPWWGHDDHFHVRLLCPANQPQCPPPPEAIPDGDGCDASLDWWFSDEAKEVAKKMATEPPKPLPVLPTACEIVLKKDPQAPTQPLLPGPGAAPAPVAAPAPSPTHAPPSGA